MLRALLLAAVEDLADAERRGEWLRAIPALDSVTIELRRRASGATSAPELARAARDLARPSEPPSKGAP